MVFQGLQSEVCYYISFLTQISNPAYVVITTGELALISIDLYVVLQLYFIKKENPESQVILNRLAAVMFMGSNRFSNVLGAIMKATAAFLFLLEKDPYWFYYLITFNLSLILYEIVNKSWIDLAKVRTSAVPMERKPSVNKLNVSL